MVDEQLDIHKAAGGNNHAYLYILTITMQNNKMLL